MRFKDKGREKQRQAALKQRQKQQEDAPARQKHARQPRPAAPQPEVHLPAARRRKLQERDDIEEMQSDYALLKKLKRGKISTRQFEVAAGLTDSDSDA